MKQICLYLLLARIVFSNRHFKFAAVFEYYAVRSNVFFLVMNPVQTHHSDCGEREVDLCSFTPLRIHPYTIFLTQEWNFDSQKQREKFYDNSSRRCLTQSARLHLLRRSSWPIKRNNILPSKQKQNHQKNVTNKCKKITEKNAQWQLKQKCWWQ